MPTLIVILKQMEGQKLVAHGIVEDVTVFGPHIFENRPQLSRYIATYFEPATPMSVLLAL
jgi:hypothetical protein